MHCLVVGAGAGLGAALARRFARGGYDLSIVGRTRSRLDRLRDALAEEVPEARFSGFAADAADERQLRDAIGAADRWAGPVDVLIYNAAAMEPDDGLPSAALVERQLRTTLGGAITSVEAVVPAMRAAGRGTILITGGGLALEPYPEWASLAAGKAALRSITLSWHKALAGDGIRVASVAVCGIVEPGGPFDPDLVADQYWALHQQPVEGGQRELVHLPAGADPFYNDPEGRHRDRSQPVEALPVRGVLDH